MSYELTRFSYFIQCYTNCTVEHADQININYILFTSQVYLIKLYYLYIAWMVNLFAAWSYNYI